MEGTTSPTAAAKEFYQYSPINETGVFDGIKGDDLRFQTTANGFVVITLGQSQLIKNVRVYTDEVARHYILRKKGLYMKPFSFTYVFFTFNLFILWML